MAEPLRQDAPPDKSITTSGAKVLDLDQAAAPVPAPSVTKVIVAVHGVGDQHSFATIQSVVNQFLRFYKERGTVPLGKFHGQPVYSLAAPFPVDLLRHLAFAEVYWAGIPRETVSKKYILEETKNWGRTIVERLRMRWRAAKKSGWDGGCVEADFDRLDQVLTEMISTVAVLERLCFLADKAGVFTFDLRKLIDDYLGDVQVVAEFDDLRRQILEQFSTTLSKVQKAYPNAEIYLVAHSEGTVVSFLGLLEAARAEQRPAWLEKVRGLMTFGSPIDKHLILWPELFGTDGPAKALAPRIEWWNYYDKGCPPLCRCLGAVAHRLLRAVPGGDDLHRCAGARGSELPDARAQGDGDRRAALRGDVDGADTAADAPTSLAMGCLGRLPVSAGLFLVIVPPREDFELLVERDWATWIKDHWHFDLPSGGTRVIIATLLVVAVYWISARKPLWGLKPLLVLGGAAVTGFVATYVLAARTAGETGAVWPVVLAGAAFLYLWWLAALIFDLVFVWHVYIRQAEALKRMRMVDAQPRLAAAALG